MVTNVDEAFFEFLRNTVNLDHNESGTAKRSRNHLIDNINGFSGDDDFFVVYEKMNLNYGSFQRKTKIRELDDIDLMICLSAEGSRTYSVATKGTIYINGNKDDENNALTTDSTSRLNSTKVINRLKIKLEKLPDYKNPELHKNKEAVTLKMKTRDWNFDILPCFHTKQDFYLIPDGEGNWKKTDPRIDNQWIEILNQKHNGKLLDLIRLLKYWNKRKVALKIGSYLLECMILRIYDNAMPCSSRLDKEFTKTLGCLSKLIKINIKATNGFQGNINKFNTNDRNKISKAMYGTYLKAKDAIQCSDRYGDQKGAIEKWREIFGDEFPECTG